MMDLRSYGSLGVAGVQLNVTTDAANKLSSVLLHYKNKGDNITVIHKCFLPTLSVIAFSDLKVLTKRSVGRISRRDLAKDVCEMFHFVQHDKLCE